MIFIILLLMVFGVVLSTMYFGNAPSDTNTSNATPKAQVYAVNMETWHQAAMLALKDELTDENNGNATCAAGATSPCAVALNSYIWDANNGATKGTLAANWKEYQPMVDQSRPNLPGAGGWQSYLLRHVNGTCADTGSCPAASESYVVTIFRGFGFSGGQNWGNAIPGAIGTLDGIQMATALSKTVQDRMGVGTLQCTGTICTFTRAAAFVANGADQQDKPLQFDAAILTAATNYVPAGTAADIVSAFNGRPAIMTRVAEPGPPGMCNTAKYVDWNDTSASPAPQIFSASTVQANYNCLGVLPTGVNSGVTKTVTNTNSGYTGTAQATCVNGTWTNAVSGSCTSSPGPGGNNNGNSCDAAPLSWGGGNCYADFPSASDGDLVSETSQDAQWKGMGKATCHNGVWSVTGSCTAIQLPSPN